MKFTIESSETFIAEAITNCWKCNERTLVVCLYCKRGWIDGEEEAHFSVSNVTAVNPVVADALKQYSYFHPARSNTADMTYYANHCEHCRALQGDFYLHSEPGGAFFPEDVSEGVRHIAFVAIDGLAEMTGEIGQGPLCEVFERTQLS